MAITTKTVSWASSNDSYCSVDSNGYITAISPGNVTITATAIDGSSVSASCGTCGKSCNWN